MRGIGNFVVIYDISCDRERTRVEKALKGFGFRAQKSVFECRLTRKGRDDMLRLLTKLQVRTGFLKVYRVEHSSPGIVIGTLDRPGRDEGSAYVV